MFTPNNEMDRLGFEPAQGYYTGGLPMMLLGASHGVIGVLVRPGVGLLEMIAKSSAGLGLVCLGSRAISGSTLKRVRAPGALLDDSLEVG
jgi:hypothetical protein